MAVALVAAIAVAALYVVPRGILPSTSAPVVPHFVDEALGAGVDQRYEGDFTFYVGGGVAAFDCDGDGATDLFLAGGSSTAALYRNRSTPGGKLAFEKVADPTTDLRDVTGAYPIDIDSDGNIDLVVLRYGGYEILRGLGGCRFQSATAALGLDGGSGWNTAFSATWEGADVLPTMAIGRYAVLDANQDVTGTCEDDQLLRPSAAGGGYASAVALSPSWCTLSMLFSDWSRSGRRDLRVSNDRHYYRDGEEQLWLIQAGAAPRSYTESDGWMPLQIWGMGIASRDLTGDGLPEVFLTSQGDNKLQTLQNGASKPTYDDIALPRGVTATRPFTGDEHLASTAWHPAFEDVNNDGLTDLYVSKGNVERELDMAMQDPSDLLIGQPDGTFVEGAMDAGIVDFASARGAAVVDLNGDGLLDLVQVVRRDHVRLWRNLGAGDVAAPRPLGSWLGIWLEQPAPNRDAIGAWLQVRTAAGIQEREITIGGGHASGQLVPIHVGIGSSDRADVRVTWPDGQVGPWLPVMADQTVVIDRGAPGVTPWSGSHP
jgi:hypothetical protein